MKVIEGKRVMYDSDEEFYAHQARRSKRHDNNRLVKGRIAEALRFYILGGKLDYTDPPIERADPNFAPDVRILDVGCGDGWSLEYAIRHYFATELIRKGVGIYKVSRILGHSSVKTTESIYIHLVPIDLLGLTDCLD